MVNTFLGRMCLSGDVAELTRNQWNLIDEGIRFYRKIAEIIKHGQSYRYGPESPSIRHPTGWQAIVRIHDEGKSAYVTLHVFAGTVPECIEILLPDHCPGTIAEVYSDTQEKIFAEAGGLKYYPTENRKAAAVLLKSDAGEGI